LNLFFKKDIGLLVSPNKCASTYARTVIPAEYQLSKKQVKDLEKNDYKVFCQVRDPIEWYVSGWRMCASGILSCIRETGYNLTWEEHLELCYKEHEEYFSKQNWNGNQPSQFAVHCWFNPVCQGYRGGRGRVSQWIKIENKKRFNKIIRLFNGVPKDKKENEYTQKNVESRRPGKHYYDKPVLTKKSIKFLHKLGTWSKEAGYDLDQCIENYINTL
jgi:hypothetical protein